MNINRFKEKPPLHCPGNSHANNTAEDWSTFQLSAEKMPRFLNLYIFVTIFG